MSRQPPDDLSIRTRSLTQAGQLIVHISDDRSFDIRQLKAIIGKSPVVVLLALPPYFEDKIKRAGLYTPSYYYSLIGVTDARDEQREIDELT